MPIFRTLIKTLIREHNPRSHPSPFTFQPPLLSPYSSSSLSAAPNPFSFIHRLTSSHSRLFSPLSLFLPFSGPLFLSPTPWKLSQAATPLYLRGKDAAFPKDLLRAKSIPIGLGLRGETEDAIWWKRRSGDNERAAAEAGSEEKFLNLPNLISIGRGVSGPFLGWMIMNEWYFPAFIGLAVSGATDWLDGFLARKMGINSVFGSYLDPLADKVLIGCVALAMVKQDLLHPGLVGLVVFRDVALVSGAVYKRASSLGWEWKSWSEFVNLDAAQREKVEPLLISKVNTVFQLLLVAGALLQPEFGSEATRVYIDYLSWLVASTTVASSAAYGVQHLRSRSAFSTEKRCPSSSNKLS